MGKIMHVVYRDVNNKISDIWWDGSVWDCWNLSDRLQAKNPPAADGNPYILQYGDSMHVMYRDVNDQISDIWWDGSSWAYPHKNLSELVKTLPAAKGDPCIVQYGDSMHVMYRDVNDQISDFWWDNANLRWAYPHKNLSDLVKTMPAAYGNPCIINSTTIHVVYRDINGKLSDIWWDNPNGVWKQQNLSDLVDGAPTADKDPCMGLYFSGMLPADLHVLYHDYNSQITDLVWKQLSGWTYQTLDPLLDHISP
jgi:hypothetical protein